MREYPSLDHVRAGMTTSAIVSARIGYEHLHVSLSVKGKAMWIRKRSHFAAIIGAVGLLTSSHASDAGSASVGDLLVSQFGTDAGVRRYDPQDGTFLGVFASDGVVSHWSATYGPDGDLYSSRGNGTISRFNGQDGTLIGTFADLSFAIATGMTFGPDGHLYVATEGTSVRRLNGSTGVSMGDFVSAGSGGLARAEELTFGPDDNLYVADGDNDRVLRYDGSDGSFIDVFVTDAAIGHVLVDLEFGPDGSLYLLDTNATVRRYHGQTGVFLGVFVPPGSGGLGNVFHMTFGPDGHLYIPSGSLSDTSVRRYNGQTGAFMGIVVPHASGGLEFPYEILFVPCLSNADCSDQDLCNGIETCDGGQCAGGTALSCNDGNPCTNDTCNAATGCAHAFNTDACDDGDACTLNDRCSGGACVGQPAGSLIAYDIAPCEGNGRIDIDDIIAVLNAFSGNYACSVPCP